MRERAPGLTPVRLAIDGVDDGLVLLLAARTRLARLAGRLKAGAGVPGRDEAREQCVRRRAETLASVLGVTPDTASGVLALAIGDARRAQMVELVYFGGLSRAEVAAALSVSEGTVDRDLRLARAWLRTALEA